MATRSQRWKELKEQFKAEVSDKANELDPQDWISLVLGWAVAKGVAPSEAHEFAVHVRYKTDLTF